jgi:hypothetical protein
MKLSIRMHRCYIVSELLTMRPILRTPCWPKVEAIGLLMRRSVLGRLNTLLFEVFFDQRMDFEQLAGSRI